MIILTTAFNIFQLTNIFYPPKSHINVQHYYFLENYLYFGGMTHFLFLFFFLLFLIFSDTRLNRKYKISIE